MNGIEEAASTLGVPPAHEHVFNGELEIFVEPEPERVATLDVAAQKAADAQRRKDLRFAIAQANVERMALDRQMHEWRRELASLKAVKR